MSTGPVPTPIREETELGEARRRVQRLVYDLPGGEGQAPFHEPWELRAFAIAVAAYHAGQVPAPVMGRQLRASTSGRSSSSR